MKHRVIAKLVGLPHHFCLCCALRRIHRLEEAIGDTVRRKLDESVEDLANIFQIYYRMLRVEWREAAPVALKLYKEELAKQPVAPAGCTGDHVWLDNRIIWGWFLIKGVVAERFKTRMTPFTALQTLLRTYMSILDGESQVERDLGSMRASFKNMMPLRQRPSE